MHATAPMNVDLFFVDLVAVTVAVTIAFLVAI
jgi:hypothetical protein